MDWRGNGRWMKWCWRFLLCVTAAGTSFAQGISEGVAPPNIEIVKLKWQREVRLPRNFDPAILPAGATYVEPASKSSTNTGTGGASDSTRSNAATTSRGPSSSEDIIFPRVPARLPVFYVYSLKIRNTGAKAIEGIAWDYLFIDPNSNTELDRHQFLSYSKVAANSGAAVRGELRAPPTRVLRASDAGKNSHPRFIERAEIECVLYADNTLWQNRSSKEGVCELLRSGKALVKRKRG